MTAGEEAVEAVARARVGDRIVAAVQKLKNLGPVTAAASSGLRIVGVGTTCGEARNNWIIQASSDEHDEDALIDFIAWALNNRAAIAAMPFIPQESDAEVTEAIDEDGLDIIEALVADATAVEGVANVHEGGGYFAERVIRRAIEQGNLRVTGPASHPAMTSARDREQPK